MGLRDELHQLDATVDDQQRGQIHAAIGDESWSLYESLSGDDIDDEDEYKLAIVKFVVSLADPDIFKTLLTDEQRTVLEGVETQLREEMGL